MVPSGSPLALRARLGPLSAYLLVAPAVGFTVLVFLWPGALSLLQAFQDPTGGLTLDNFRQLAQDAILGPDLRNTLLLLGLSLPLETALALGMAALARARPRGLAFFLYAWSLPLAVSDLATGLVWYAMLTQRGYLSSVLTDLHLTSHPVVVLDSGNLVSLAVVVILAETWRSASLVTVVVLSGAQAIPRELDEAADALGAGPWRRFRHITMPFTKPALQAALVMRAAAALQVFALVLTLAGTGFPVLATRTERLATTQASGRAAAYALLLFAISMVLTVLALAVLRTRREVLAGLGSVGAPALPRPPSRRPAVYLAAALVTVVMLLPIYLMLLAGLAPSRFAYVYPRSPWPDVVSLDGVRAFLALQDVLPSLLRSLEVGLLSLVLSMVLGCLAGYALARYSFRGHHLVQLVLVAARAFPVPVLAVPLAATFIRWNLYDTPWGVALVHAAMSLPFTTLLSATSFARVPVELEEAAMSLRSSRLGAVFRVVLPLSRRGLALAALFAFVLSWNEVFAASTLTLRNPTLPAQVVAAIDLSPRPFRFAAGLTLTLPAFVFVLVMRPVLFSTFQRRVP